MIKLSEIIIWQTIILNGQEEKISKIDIQKRCSFGQKEYKGDILKDKK